MADRDAQQQEIVDRLRQVKEPVSGQDLVTAGCVRDTTHCDGAVKVTLAWNAPSEPVQEALARSIDAALKSLAWVNDVNLKFEEGAAAPEAPAGPAFKNVIAVGSGKGGVGKSTVAVNLAAGLARSGRKVGILDADVYGPSVPTMLGLSGRPEVTTLPDGRQVLAPLEAYELKVMSMGFLVEADQPVIWRGPMLHGALRQFLNDVDWGPLDDLIVDLPPGTGDVALTMAQSISLRGAVIVSTPQEVAMLDARKALAMFGQTNVPVLGIVENMSGEVFGTGGAERWAKKEGIPFLGSIPLQAGIREGGDAGRPAVLGKDDALSQPFLDATQKLLAQVDTAGADRPKISIRR